LPLPGNSGSKIYYGQEGNLTTKLKKEGRKKEPLAKTYAG
jgi:hypothetical protein